MFKKLVANLPFNPSLINQVGFYADRLRAEKSIRRLSFVFISLAMGVQSFAFISPSVSSLTYSNNHILSDVQNRSQLLSAYDNNTRDFKKIYERFYITRADLANLSATPNATIRTNDGNRYRTIGRTSLWEYSKVNIEYKKTERTFYYENFEDKPVGKNIYIRDLKAWDIVNSYNTYRAFEGTVSATGQKFWILAGCGNITWIPPYDQPTPDPEPEPDPDPKLKIRKAITTNATTVRPGDTLNYRIEYGNTVIDSVAEDVIIRDELDTRNFDVVSPSGLNISPSGVLLHSVGDLPGRTELRHLDITVRLKNPLPSGTEVCNAARLQADNASPVDSKRVCIDVIEPCKYDPSVPNTNDPNCVKPVVVCKVVDAAINLATRKVTFKTIVTSSNEATTQVKSYNYAFGDDTAESFNSSAFMHETMHTYAPGDYTATVNVEYTASGVEGKQTTDTCDVDISFEEDQPFGQSKTVKNITQELEGEEAINSKVNGGDILEYTLTTTNTQNYERTDITVTDYVGDLLDYAELDLASIEADGGTFDEETNRITWENVTIPANSQTELTFRIQLLDPIPSTNQPELSGDFDCQIENTYGDTISLDVNCPAVKGIETLPNTGPGASLIATTGITAGVGYFFARSRLLSKEIDLIRTDYATTGGA